MLTYELKKSPGVPLYEALYRCIRQDILSGVLTAGQKLPSKRALAANLEVSKITVEGAYEQLLAEGYIRSEEKIGYFVEPLAPLQVSTGPLPPSLREGDREAVEGVSRTTNVTPPVTAFAVPAPSERGPGLAPIDLTSNTPVSFPFSVWTKLQREVILDLERQLLRPLPNRGTWELRRAISRHLLDFRGLRVDPQNILIGAGTDFLYNLLIQLLGRDKTYAVEEPGYSKIRKIYAAGGVQCVSAAMDGQGVLPPAQAQVLHISPSHHFPTGLVTPLQRRQELLRWVRQDSARCIIEDDYDSEFRFDAHPVSAMASLDPERVIYMNTFSKTLAPSIRISYMVLPKRLMEQFQGKLGFYSCTVPSFEQYTLARFLERGYFEKHINRMRKAYRLLRDHVIRLLRSFPAFTLTEQDAGLHFLVKVDTALSDEALKQAFWEADIRVSCLSDYYHDAVPEEAAGQLVVNYSGLTDQALLRLQAALKEVSL